jgi:peroxiredoxin
MHPYKDERVNIQTKNCNYSKTNPTFNRLKISVMGISFGPCWEMSWTIDRHWTLVFLLSAQSVIDGMQESL